MNEEASAARQRHQLELLRLSAELSKKKGATTVAREPPP
jgi:hypothetical protein